MSVQTTYQEAEISHGLRAVPVVEVPPGDLDDLARAFGDTPFYAGDVAAHLETIARWHAEGISYYVVVYDGSEPVAFGGWGRYVRRDVPTLLIELSTAIVPSRRGTVLYDQLKALQLDVADRLGLGTFARVYWDNLASLAAMRKRGWPAVGILTTGLVLLRCRSGRPSKLGYRFHPAWTSEICAQRWPTQQLSNLAAEVRQALDLEFYERDLFAVGSGVS